MDFFAHQEAARKRTALLLFYYGVAVAMLVFISYFIAALAVDWNEANFQGFAPSWHPRIFLWTTCLTLSVIALGTIWRIIDLRDGGRAVAEMLGGKRVDLSPSDDLERRLRNVVEEMSIASGVPVPEIYVLERETSINAFAAGYSHGDMAVAVTRGCLTKLSRDELQGVIAHEFSHILNGDMRLNIRLLAILNGILCIYLIGRILIEFIHWEDLFDRDKIGFPLVAVVIGGLLMAIGGLGVLFARLIQAAVSRQREYLADASAVQFTRNPDGIAGALKKIGASSSKLRGAQAEAVSHFFFSNGVSEPWVDLMATHPPLVQRIAKIDPYFDGVFPVLPDDVAPDISPDEMRLGLPRTHAAVAGFRTVSVPAEKITREIGKPIQVRYAAGVKESLPPELVEAAHDPLSASALIFAMVLHTTESVRVRQLERLSNLDTTTAHLTECNWLYLNNMDDPRTRLPLLNLSLPALRTLSRPQWERFRAVLDELINFDGQVDLFEFALRRIIERNIDANWQPKKAAAVQFYSFVPLIPDYAVLLSALAHLGNSDPAAVRRALGTGLASLPSNIEVPLIAAESCGIEPIDRALTRLGAAVPHIKRVVLEACARTVACDGVVRSEEAELLRAIAESLECPIPPYVEGA